MTVDWSYMRPMLSEAQNHRCAYCGVPTVLTTPVGADGRPWNIATAEHLLTKQSGGSDDPENLVMACRVCNETRGVMGIWTFYDLVKRWRKAGEGYPCENVRAFKAFVWQKMRAKHRRRNQPGNECSAVAA